MLAQNLHKNHLYSTFAPLLMTEQNVMILDTEVGVRNNSYNKDYSQNRYRSTSRD